MNYVVYNFYNMKFKIFYCEIIIFFALNLFHQFTILKHYAYVITLNNHRDMQKVFDHCKFLLCISYKTTFFFKHYSKINSWWILMKFWPTKARTYVVFCDYFKIFIWSTNLKYSRLKHKLKLFVYKSTIIVLCFDIQNLVLCLNHELLRFLDYKIVLK